MQNLIGQSLGQYHIIEKLGEGGMATVYRAFDTRLERDVAIKIIRPEKGTSEKFIKRFQREARALAALNHKNIIPIIDFGDHEGVPYLVMPFIPGGTLKPKLGAPIPYDVAARMLIPVAGALGYAHAHGIVHRDIKPSNILLTESGDPMLSDFGVAKMLEMEETADLTGTGVGVGTPEYMSPEQTLGGAVDGRADEYSLGVVFYEMVTGRKPYQADTPLAVAIKQNTEPLPNPRNFIPILPTQVEYVILKSLAKEPANRYQTLEQFQKALLDLAEGTARQPKKKFKEPANNKSKGTQRWMVPALIGVLVLGAAAFAGFRSGWIQKIMGGNPDEVSAIGTSTPAVQQAQATFSPQAITPTQIPIHDEVVKISMPDFLAGSQVTYTEGFSSTTPDGWDISSFTEIGNNSLTLKGNNYTGGVTFSKRNLQDYQGILLAFQCSPDTEAEIFFQSGTWVTRGMRRWGIYCNTVVQGMIEPDVYQDEGNFVGESFIGNLVSEPDKWYALLLTLGGDGEFIARVWDPENPNLYTELRQSFGSEWDNKSWHLGIGASTGSISITNFQILNLRTSVYIPTATPTLTPTATPKPDISSLTIGASLTDPGGMEMMLVPAGEFMMGSAEGVGDEDEHPQHTVYLDAFWMDKTEVTVAMYKKCLDAGGCENQSYQYSSGVSLDYVGTGDEEYYPATYVSHDEAAQYCAWVGERLPSEAEWEKAAIGNNQTLYPWGDNEPDNSLANFNSNIGSAIRVGSYPAGASPYGILDLAGNVWEWTADKYQANYYQNSETNNPQGPTSENIVEYVLRGGSYKSKFVALRAQERSMDDEGVREDVGFRCVISAE